MNKIKIPLDQIRYHPLSGWDTRGKLFIWNDEIYRIILNYSEFYNSLFEKGVINNLVEKKLLVESEITDYSFGNDEFILKHKKIPYCILCF